MPDLKPPAWRLIREIIAFVGMLIIIGGTAALSTASAVIITGVLLTAAAIMGMLLTRRH